MSLLELCDIADGLWIAQIERQYLADRQAFSVARLIDKDTESAPPTWDEIRAEHYTWLAGESQDVEPDILRDLGVAA